MIAHGIQNSIFYRSFSGLSEAIRPSKLSRMAFRPSRLPRQPQAVTILVDSSSTEEIPLPGNNLLCIPTSESEVEAAAEAAKRVSISTSLVWTLAPQWDFIHRRSFASFHGRCPLLAHDDDDDDEDEDDVDDDDDSDQNPAS